MGDINRGGSSQLAAAAAAATWCLPAEPPTSQGRALHLQPVAPTIFRLHLVEVRKCWKSTGNITLFAHSYFLLHVHDSRMSILALGRMTFTATSRQNWADVGVWCWGLPDRIQVPCGCDKPAKLPLQTACLITHLSVHPFLLSSHFSQQQHLTSTKKLQ